MLAIVMSLFPCYCSW